MKFMGSIAKAFTLSLCIIANTHLAYAQTASILPPAKTTFFDSNGNPLTAGKVDFYIPGTSTRKTTWQDAAETIPNTNPVTLDAAGRALILGSGSYRQVVKDKLGNLIWDQVTASGGSGGGGTASIGDGNNVGTILPWSGLTAPGSYLFTYGQEISRVTYANFLSVATLSQNVTCASGSPTLNTVSDTTQLNIGAAVEAACIPTGSTIISKTASTVTLNNNALVSTTQDAVFFPWGNGNGLTTFNVPDLRGVVLPGRNNMGGSASTNLSNPSYTDPNALAGIGGSQSKVLVSGNLPPYTPTGTIANGAITSTFTAKASQAAVNTALGGAGNLASGSFLTEGVQGTVVSTQGASTFTGTAQGGASTAFSLIQPSKTVNYIIKVLPNYLATSLTVVTSLGGQTGDISCDTNMTCVGNSIKANYLDLNTYTNGLAADTSPNVTSDYLMMRRASDGAMVKINPTTIAGANTAGVSTVGGVSGAIGLGAGLSMVGSTLTPTPSDAASVTYTPPGTGAVTTTVKAELDRYGVWANDFGAACNGGGNDLAAFQLAINAAQSLKVPLKFTGGCVISGTLNITSGLDMSGLLAENSIIYNSDLASPIVIINAQSPVYFHDFGLNYTSASNAGVSALAVTAATENFGSVFERIRIGNNPAVGINFIRASDYRFLNSTVVAQQFAILVTNTHVPDSGDSIISGNHLQTGAGGTAIVYSSSSGLRIINNKINANANMAFGIQLALAPGVSAADLFITGNSIEGIASTGAAIWLGRSGTTGGFGVVNITGNELSGQFCVDVPTDPNGAWLINVAISGNTCLLTNVGVAFNIDSTTGLALGVNSVQSFNAGSKKIAIGSQVTGAIVDEPGGLGPFGASTYSAGAVARNPFGMPVASLSASQNGSQIYASDGTPGSSPCTGGGTGAMATRQNGAWKCF